MATPGRAAAVAAPERAAATAPPPAAATEAGRMAAAQVRRFPVSHRVRSLQLHRSPIGLQPDRKPLPQGTHVGHMQRQLVQDSLVQRAGVVEIEHATGRKPRRLAGRAAAERQSLEVRLRKYHGCLLLFY